MNEKNKIQGFIQNFAVSGFAILISLVVSGLVMLAVGYDPILAYTSMFEGAFGSTQAIAGTLSKAIPLIFCGLSFAFAFKNGVFNIGGEGQLYLGALVSTAIALALEGMPKIIVLPLCLLGGFLGGGLLGVLLGFAKSKLKLNEVIVAIMLNYIVQLFVSYMANGPMKAIDSMIPQTEAFDPVYMFNALIPRTQLTTALFLGIFLCIVIYFFFAKTRAGYNIRVTGLNPNAGIASGINFSATMMLAMGISGGLAGLAGFTEVFGKYGRFIDGFSPGFGFTGIAVSVLAANNPIGIIFPALLFGAMDAGAMTMSYTAGISANMIDVIQGLVIILVATPNIAKKLLIRKREVKVDG